MTEPFDLTVSEAASAIREKHLSSVELMQSLISISQKFDPLLHVWVTLDPESAIASSRLSDRNLHNDGPSGPLHGIPIGVKDIFSTQDMKTTSGSPIYSHFQPDFDATAVSLLKRSGAIIMGKTVTTEFACTDPAATLNPWNKDHTPGGSSSGSAVGVATRMFPAALGSQTSGSILRPASYNGVIGMKPSFGLISRYGVTPVSSSLDTMGVFCRTVQDTTLMLHCLARYDPKDPVSINIQHPDYVQCVAEKLRPPKIALATQFFLEKADDEVKCQIYTLVEKLSQQGAEIQQLNVDSSYSDLIDAHQIVLAVEAATYHQRQFNENPELFAPKLRGMLESGMRTSAVSYIRSQQIRELFRTEMEKSMLPFDVILSPTTASVAPMDRTTTGDPVFQIPWTSCGFPSITLPLGLTDSGLPTGFQLASPRLNELELMKVAFWCQEVLNLKMFPDPVSGSPLLTTCYN